MDWSLIYRVGTSPSTFWGFAFFAIIVWALLGVTHSLLQYFKVKNIPTSFFVKTMTWCLELFVGSAFILCVLHFFV